MRHPIVLLAVLALAVAACGDSDKRATEAGGRAPGVDAPSATPSPPTPHPIVFVDGLAAGRKAAGDPDALLFVYLGRHHPT